MIRSLTTLLAIITLAAASAGYAKPHQIDAAKSRLQWTGSKVIGDKHVGTLKIKRGVIDFANKAPRAADVTVDMTTIVNEDVKDPKWNKKLVDHLKSDDFFSVAKFKESRISLNKFQQLSANTFKGRGQLVIKNIPSPIEVTFKALKGKGPTKLQANFTFDRTRYNIKYNSGKFFPKLGDKIIRDQVQVEVTVQMKDVIQLGMN